MITCTRRIEFCAGHRVLGHENKCASWHGHQYIVEVTAKATELDGVGRVLDFSVLKERIGGYIEREWDHGFLIYEADTEMRMASKQLLSNHKTVILPVNPTAENLAKYLLTIVIPKLLRGLSDRIRVVSVVVHETPNCKAEASLE